MQRTTSRRWTILIGVLLIVSIVSWLASPVIVTTVLENRLRRAGFVDVSIAGASLGLGGIDIRSVQLALDGRFVLEDVHASVDASSIKEILVGRLYLESEISGDGGFPLPGLEPMPAGPPNDFIDILPDGGIRIGAAEIHLATPWPDVMLTLADANIQLDTADTATARSGYALSTGTAVIDDAAAAAVKGMATARVARGGSVELRLDVTEGFVAAPGLRGEGLTGTATANLSPTASPVIELALGTTDTRVMDMGFGPASLDAALRDDVADMRISSSGSDAVEFVVDGRAHLTDNAPLIDLTGRASFKGATRGELNFDLTGVSLGDDSATGRLRITGSDLLIPGLLNDGSIDAAAEIAGNRNRLRLSAARAWTATFEPDNSIVPAAMSGLEGQRTNITIMSPSDGPLEMSISWTDSTAELEADVRVQAGKSRVDAAARLAASWATELAVAADTLTLQAADLPWQSLMLGIDGFQGRAAFADGTWEVPGAGALRASGALGELGLRGLTMQWAGTLSGSPTGLSAVASECLEWDVARIVWRSMRIDDLTPPCIQTDGSELLGYDAANGRVRFTAAAANAPLQVRLEHEVTEGTQENQRTLVNEYDISGTWPQLRLNGAIGNGSGVDLSADLAGGALSTATYDIAIAGMDGAVTIRAGALQSWRLTAAVVESLADPAWWAPASLEASAQLEADALAFEALISDTLGTFVLEAAGKAQGGNGSSALKLYPLRLISGATELRDLSPLLADIVRDATGTVAFDGDIEWGPDGIESAGRLSLESFGATVAGVPVSGLDTQTGFASLWPLATQREQVAEIATVDLGIPLANGRAVYDVDADGRIAIHQLDFGLAGGRIHSEPFTFDSATGDDIEFRLVVEDVELAQMLELSKINGLQGTGVLSGSIPVRISGNKLYLDAGRLAADTDGSLRYTPASLPAFLRGDDQRTQMLREALTNFQYDELSVTVSGESGEGGRQTVRFDALGANPDFLDGHPVELAFTFSGPLLGAMSSAASVAGAAEIQELFEQQQNNLENTQ